jgi:hypothetical protein
MEIIPYPYQAVPQEAAMRRQWILRAPALCAAGLLLAGCNFTLSSPFLGASGTAAAGTPAAGDAAVPGAGGGDDQDEQAPTDDMHLVLLACPKTQSGATIQITYDHFGAWTSETGQRYTALIRGTQRVRIVADKDREAELGGNSGIRNLDNGPVTAIMTAAGIEDCGPGLGSVTIKSEVTGTCIDDLLTLYITQSYVTIESVTLSCSEERTATLPILFLYQFTTKWEMPIRDLVENHRKTITEKDVWWGGKLDLEYHLEQLDP